MQPGPEVAGISAARGNVARLRDALLSPTPERIETCLPGLVEAASSIRGGSLEELRALQKELRGVKALIGHGEEINRGLARLLGARMGYTSRGEAAPLEARTNMSVRG